MAVHKAKPQKMMMMYKHHTVLKKSLKIIKERLGCTCSVSFRIDPPLFADLNETNVICFLNNRECDIQLYNPYI
jgi:hypothetical protein